MPQKNDQPIDFALQGDRHTTPLSPILSMIPNGRQTFLWCGTASTFLGTLEGVPALRKLANAILEEVGPAPRRKPKARK